MEDDLDATVIKNTQLSLGKYVKRPPLTDKLLRKPPFRFLHDIVTSVLKSKGFFEGLFDENELISDNVKDRESKISFLNKVITVVSLSTGKPLTVKPSKIVAGQEPVKTNELLQCLAQALENNISSDEAVKQFKSGVKISPSNDKKNKENVKTLKKTIEPKKLTSKSSEKLINNDKDDQSHSKSKTKDISAVHKKESPPKKSLSKTSYKKPSERLPQDGKKNIASEQKIQPSGANPNPVDISKDKDQEPRLNEETVVLDKDSSSNEKVVEHDIDSHKDLSDLLKNQVEEQPGLDAPESGLKPPSANNSIRSNEEESVQFEIIKAESVADNYALISNKRSIDQSTEGHTNQLTHQSKNEEMKNEPTNNLASSEISQMDTEESSKITATTTSFDKREINSSNVIRPSSVRPSSSRPGPPRIRDKSDNVMNDAENIVVGKVNIISENTLQEEGKDSSMIIETNMRKELPETLQTREENNLETNQNSHLVQQILDSQREFSQISGKTEIEWQFGAQKAPDIFIQEMEQLKFSVQAMSRIANPLGKLLDHIQEDVEVMRQELQQWTQLYEQTSKDLITQKNANNEALLPFHAKLKQLTVDTEEKHEKITDLKICIYKNNSRIEKLLSNNNVQ